MPRAAIPVNDAARVATLRALGLLDTPPEERFDRITRMATRLLGTPFALVSLVDANRQWFKSRQGAMGGESPRDESFCAYSVLSGQPLVVHDAEKDLRFSDNPLVIGDPKIRSYAGWPIAAPNGMLLGTLCVIDNAVRDFSEDEMAALQDLAAMVENEIAHVALAMTDELTGLANRRGFFLQGGKVLEVCRRQKLDLTIAYLDLDDFKSINDRFGHAEGDAALRATARLIEGSLRASDVVARLGGDEFAIFLTDATRVDAKEALERLCEQASAQTPESGCDYRIQLSFGTVTRLAGEVSDFDALMAEADAEMYAAKQAGKAARNHLPEPVIAGQLVAVTEPFIPAP